MTNNARCARAAWSCGASATGPLHASPAHPSLPARTLVSVVSVVSLVSGGCRAPQANPGNDASAAATVASSEARSARAEDAATPPDDLLPANVGGEFAARAHHLLDAIAHDDAQFATDLIFPRDGWLATREASDPGKDWERRVAAPFRRAIHALSRRHAQYEEAQSVSVELGSAMSQAIPKRHGWRKPLWIVHDSTLTFVVDGHTRMLRIREMVAWRGAWYVTRVR